MDQNELHNTLYALNILLALNLLSIQTCAQTKEVEQGLAQIVQYKQLLAEAEPTEIGQSPEIAQQKRQLAKLEAQLKTEARKRRKAAAKELAKKVAFGLMVSAAVTFTTLAIFKIRQSNRQ